MELLRSTCNIPTARNLFLSAPSGVNYHFRVHHRYTITFSTGHLNLSDTVSLREIQHQEVPIQCPILDTIPGVVVSIVCFVWCVVAIIPLVIV